jgi:hypothetical protein
MDVHVHGAVTSALRARLVDVLTAQEDLAGEFDDSRLLSRAAELNRVLVTHDKDFLFETTLRLRTGRSFAGVVYSHQRRLSVGELIENLEILVHTTTQEEWIDRIGYLPL